MESLSRSSARINQNDARWLLAQRIVASSHLSSSPKLCEFFLYVVGCCLRDAPEDATEQQIGIHVFHRQPGYNTSENSVVRSQARLLRLKLAAYFAAEGAEEELTVEIPKGHYLPIFQANPLLPVVTAVGEPEVPPQDRLAPQPVTEPAPVEAPPSLPAANRGRILLPLLLFVLAGIVAGVLSAALYNRGAAPQLESSLKTFWGPFLHGQPPLVIYSNPLFIGTPETGLRLAPQESQSSESPSTGPADETYTGVGEVAAVHTLTRLFDSYHREFVLKRSRLVAWDEARQLNLIFVGAPSQNGALHDLPTTTDFAIRVDSAHKGFILNQHPAQGEPATFVPTSPNDEYAILALIPGMESGQHIAIFTGLTTSGTQAAVEFACQPDNLKALTQRVGRSGGAIRPFEAVLHITLSRGVPLRAEIVAAHAH